MSVLNTTLALFSFVILYIYYLYKKKCNYWSKRNVPFVEPTPFFGNYKEFMLFKKYPGKIAQELCQKFPGAPFVGTFYGMEPALIVQDPEIIKLVLVKDFYYFNGREVSDQAHKEVVTQNMFFSSGDNWRMVRQNLTPLFSSAKIKSMFPLVEKCSHELEDMLELEVGEAAVLEVRGLAARFTMECICSCGFGINGNVMMNIENNPFRAVADSIFANSVISGLKLIARSLWPAIFYGLGLQLFPPTIDAFFSKVLKDVFEDRNYEPTKRNDFVDLLLQLKKDKFITADSMKGLKTGELNKLTWEVKDEFLVAQCIMFFGAGFETTSTTIGFTLYELAKNQTAQKRVLSEVDDYLKEHGNKVDYDCIKELPYINACVYEALRLYPIFGILNRETMENYTFPSGLQIDKGTRIHIPIYHLHRNPDVFPEPDEYRPERFLPGQQEFSPYMYLPYGGGLRVCIGSRLAKLVFLTGLITIFKRYRVEMADVTPSNLELDPKTIVIQPVSGITLRLVQREGWEQRTFQR